jgi:hypothetical protein
MYPDHGPTQPLSPGVKLQECEEDHSTSSDIEVLMCEALPLTPFTSSCCGAQQQ